jgi:diaminohydroxyphosphoribosylaminopyrimidine deaminase/5-amino-6-(5-phosphoribosylamino)uracil reductase
MKPGFGLGGIFLRTLDSNFDIRTAKNLVATITPESHEYWMAYALQVSMNAVGWSAPNPAVGCVIVKNKTVIAEGFTQAYRHEHAERMAFQNLAESAHASEDLKDAVVYVTLEPCSHTGFQPPCVDLLLASPIKTFVIACSDPDERVSGLGIEKLKQAGKTVIVGVLEEEVRAWHFPFLKNKEIKKPVWIGKWAQTKDGYLADSVGASQWITNEHSRAYTHWLRQKYDAILVGAGTWLEDHPRLDVRNCAGPVRRHPIRLIFDPRAKLSIEQFGLSSIPPSAENPIYVFTCSDYFPKREELPPGVNRILVPATSISENFISSFQSTVEKMQFDRPLQSVFCEGGPLLLSLLLKENIFSALHVFTGVKEFSSTDDRYQVSWKPNEDWVRLCVHNFEDDYLHEWVNCR